MFPGSVSRALYRLWEAPRLSNPRIIVSPANPPSRSSKQRAAASKRLQDARGKRDKLAEWLRVMTRSILLEYQVRFGSALQTQSVMIEYPNKSRATIFSCPLSCDRNRVAMKKEAARKRPESREETPKEGIRRQVAAP
jgi:hypothetical protein